MQSHGKDTAIAVLAVLEVLTLVAVVVLALLLRRERRDRVLDVAIPARTPPPPKAQQAAEWAVRTVFDTASRVRERGLIEGLVLAPIEDLTRWAAEDREAIDEVASPDGTVSILFSDIQDSTQLNESLGDDGWVRVLDAHDRLVRSQVGRHRGHLVKSQGDGFMVVFGEPSEAVAAALGIQRGVGSSGRRLRRTPLKVRIGIHCGTAISRDGDYFGRNVALAARVAARAEGGQILVTDDVKEWLDDRGAPRLRLTEHDEVQLKGLTGTHRLWEVDRG